MASGLSVEVGLSLLGLYPWWGKLRLVTSRSRPSFVVVSKALAMARLLAAASLLVNLPPSSSRFCPLAPYCYTLLPGWHPTAPRRLAPYCYTSAGTLLLIVVGWHPLCPVAPLAYLSPSIVRPFLSYTWLLYSTASVAIVHVLDRCNDLRGHVRGYSRPTVSVFSPVGGHLPTPLRPAFRVFEQVVSFVLGSLRKGLGLSTCTFLCIVFLRVWGILS